jgi:hypothetical protein
MRVRDVPVTAPALLRSRLRQVLRPAAAAFWWNEGIRRRGSETTTDVADQFSRNEAWHGCEVSWSQLKHNLDVAGLVRVWTDIVSAADTHFVFLVLRKR